MEKVVVKSGCGYLIRFENDMPLLSSDVREAARLELCAAVTAMNIMFASGFSAEITLA